MPIDSNAYDFTYIADPVSPLIITGIAPVRRRGESISIEDSLRSPNSCSLTGGNAADAARLGVTHVPPVVGANVTMDTLGRMVFAGTVLTTHQTYDQNLEQLKWHADLVDFTWQFNRLVPFDTFTAVSATTVVQALVSDYAPGFTTDHVEAGLDAITVTFAGEQTLGECLDTICTLLGGAFWKVDYDLDVHLTLVPETDEVPDDLVDGSATLQRQPPLRYTRDLSQVRTRVFVRGTGSFATVNDTGAQTALAVIMGGDGIIEAPVVSRPELLTEAACIAYGEALLSIWSSPIETVTYATRDPKTASGKTVTVNLTDPPVTGEFLIQSVSISQVAEHGSTFPLYQVTASSVLFTLEDVLRQMAGTATQSITGNAHTADYATHAGSSDSVPYPNIAAYVRRG